MIEGLFEHEKFICLSVDLMEDIKISLLQLSIEQNGLSWNTHRSEESVAFIEIMRDYHSICVPFN